MCNKKLKILSTITDVVFMTKLYLNLEVSEEHFLQRKSKKVILYPLNSNLLHILIVCTKDTGIDLVKNVAKMKLCGYRFSPFLNARSFLGIIY